MNTAAVIPLEQVAADARPLIAAFRDAGSVSFQDVGLETSRDNYLASCRANGPVHPGAVESVDRTIAGVPCRVYSPAEAADSPATLVFLHGGGWVVGDLDTHDALCRYLAAGSGYRIVAVHYRLAPEHPYPAAHDDALAVAAAVLSADGEFADGPVLIAGDSAGGNLAAWVARAAARGDFERSPVGQVLLYPVTDLTLSSRSYEQITAGFPLTAASMGWFADHYAPEVEQRDEPALSPALHPLDTAQTRAFVVTVGLDPLADEGILYAGMLASAGTRVEHHHLPRHTHGLITSSGRIATGSQFLDRAVGFMRECVEAS